MSKRVALLSVYRKEGIVDFARALIALDWEIIASGGTAKVLSDSGLVVLDVADFVGGGAVLGHRVVTLSREVHAGLLATRSESDMRELAELGVPFIDLVCVDLYPLVEEVANPRATVATVIEKTDIGGPTILRSAAKGRRVVIADAQDRELVLRWLQSGEPECEMFVNSLVAKAEYIVAQYCLVSAQYHGHGQFAGLMGELHRTLAYGENPWQTPAGFFSVLHSDPLAVDAFRLVVGSDGFNNVCDLDRLLQTITHVAAAFDVYCEGNVPAIAIGVKHGNACGAAVAQDASVVLQRMIGGDPEAIFGGSVMTNFCLTEHLAEILLTAHLSSGRRLLDCVFVPEITDGAIAMLRRKRDKCKVLVNPALGCLGLQSLDTAPRIRQVRGGFLMQPNYRFVLRMDDPALVNIGNVDTEQMSSLLLAWAVGSTSNSNTITLVRDSYLIGNGVGQQSRVSAAKLALMRARDAGHSPSGAVAYSDSFFPFIDGPKILGEAGIRAVLTSSGSVNDAQVIKAFQEWGVKVLMIPDKVGRGFSHH